MDASLSDITVRNMMADIYESCFSQVSDTFLETVAQIIAEKSGTQTVIVHRLLTFKEYIDLKYNDGCPHVQLIGQDYDTDEEEELIHSPTSQKSVTAANQKTKVAYFFIKAAYSTKKHASLAKYTAAPVSQFPADSPLIQTIQKSKHHTVQNDTFIDCVYPSFKSYVGIRLDENNSSIGLISVMDDNPITPQQIDLIQHILSVVKTRTKNEIERIRQKDHLIMMKNNALRDAESKIKFLAEMSHEIRTPMNAVVALTDLLLQERDNLNDEQEEHLGVIQTSGNHLLTVINDILDISKMNHNPKFKLENRRFSIRKCVKDALNMARHQASLISGSKSITVVEIPNELKDDIPLDQLVKQLDAKNCIPHSQEEHSKQVIPLIWKVEDGIPDHLLGDSMRLTQILLNLCSNAVKFTKHGGIRIRVNISRSCGPQEEPDCNYGNFKDRYDAEANQAYSRGSEMGRKDSPTNQEDYYYEEDSTNTDDSSATSESEQEIRRKITLEISVTDTGIGMPADRLPRLFKSFSQIDISTARRYGGTGLGLAISSMLVNRMGGGLWVESEEGLGSRFALTLPIEVSNRPPVDTPQTTSSEGSFVPSCPASPCSSDGSLGVQEQLEPQVKKQPVVQQQQQPQVPVNNNMTMNMSRGLRPHQEKQKTIKKTVENEETLHLIYPLKILLAEDNVLNQKIAVSILKRLGYQDVIIAGNGREALELMRTHTFDVIFMDLYMPEMDGLEATRCIISERKQPQVKNPLLNLDEVYIIALTASASRQDRQICINAGMNDFISKPFTMTEMQSALRNLSKKKPKRRKKPQQLLDETAINHEQIVPESSKQLCQA